MAPCWIDFDASGTTRSMSSSMMLPNPWHVGHAPNGLLNENNLGCGSSYAMPQVRQSKRSENTRVTGDWGLETDDSIAQAAPTPSWYDVPIESVRKSTRLNSSHRCISYAVFCLKKKKKYKKINR